MQGFDSRFTKEIPFVFSYKMFLDQLVWSFQLPDQSRPNTSAFPLPWLFINSLITTNGGLLHSYDDRPAVILPNGDLLWYKNGKLHRDNGPAVVGANGAMKWYKNGILHNRSGGPSLIREDGTMIWMKNGKIHRKGKPAVIDSDGELVWYQNNELHREDGPAIIGPSGTVQYYRRGKLFNPYSK